MSGQAMFTYSFDLGGGVSGMAVVDSLIAGTSSGGVRIAPDVDPAEVASLAGEMTLKYGFFGLPRGGAKCGIRIPGDIARDRWPRLLEQAGARLAPLIGHGIYYPGMDMNCGPDELRALYRGAGVTLGEITDTSLYTAVFAASAVKAAGDFLLPGGGRPLTLAVEGFGKVAMHLASMLDPGRFRIVALSTVGGAVRNAEGYSAQALAEARRAHGDALYLGLPGERLEPRELLLEEQADILVPAARVGSIDEAVAARVRASCVVSVANAPCTEAALGLLHARGVMVLPGFVCNAGGVLGSSLFDRGVPAGRVQALADGPYGRVVAGLLAASRELGAQPTLIAASLARDRIARAAARSRESSRLTRVLGRLSRRSRLVSGFVNRDAEEACRRHLEALADDLGRLHAGGWEELG